jgi:hypothetical protein
VARSRAQAIGADAPELTARFRYPVGNMIGLNQTGIGDRRQEGFHSGTTGGSGSERIGLLTQCIAQETAGEL